MAEFHVTERDTWKFCRRQWDFAYRQSLAPLEENKGALWLGRGYHAGLAQYYRSGGRISPLEGFEEWLSRQLAKPENVNLDDSSIQENVDLARTMLEGYVSFSQQHDDFSEIVAVEQPIRIRVPGTYHYLVGTIDLLVRRKGRLWIVDHKGYKSFVNPADLERDDQMTAYCWLVWMKYGEVPAGAIYNQLLKRIPATPMLIRNGTALSKAKDIVTTPERYLQAIHDNGFNPADYADILEVIGNTPFYCREYIARSIHRYQTFTDQLVLEVRDMGSKHVSIYPHHCRDCSWGCSFKSLCACVDDGGDVEEMKRVNYRISPGRED